MTHLRRAVKRSISEPEDGGDDNEAESGNVEEEPSPDNQSILRLLEDNEKVNKSELMTSFFLPIESKQ